MRLDLVVGPNGSGKSTLVELVVARAGPSRPCVNADVIAAERWPESPAEHSYDAALIAADARTRLIAAGLPFIAETVFSHPSKLDLVRGARDAGYAVTTHVVLVPVDLAVARVRRRVQAGGHAVPEHKIRQRYERLWPLVRDAIAMSDLALVHDNADDSGPRVVARLRFGELEGRADWPAWTPQGLRGGS